MVVDDEIGFSEASENPSIIAAAGTNLYSYDLYEDIEAKVFQFNPPQQRINSFDLFDIDKIKKHLSNLEPIKKNDDELARRFDILNLMLQICILSGSGDSNKLCDRGCGRPGQ